MTHRQKRRAEYLEILGGSCVKCGTKEKLEFDHIDPNTKLTEIARIMSARRTLVLKELEKCQLLCEPCHKEKTATENK